MTANRIMIDAAAGVFELEGEAEFVSAQLDKLLPIVKTGGFPKPDNTKEEEETFEAPQQTPQDVQSQAKTNGTKKSKRGTGTRPPKGHSCADRMMTLITDGFFKEQKTPAQIVEGLGAKGWTHTSNQVSAAGGQMFNRGAIQRTKAGNGFAYYWDRE
ncbi:MAG: hypothetical protein NXH97_15045 [Rhodobacteraceae bacterium]|nr:hypothetical protein [Paracoccaceae bacterium]